MTFDHLLSLFKIGTSIVKKEKAPVTVSPSLSTVGFDGKDLAIFFLGIALIFSMFAVFTLAATAAARR